VESFINDFYTISFTDSSFGVIQKKKSCHAEHGNGYFFILPFMQASLQNSE
jgi:hypothetical protein